MGLRGEGRRQGNPPPRAAAGTRGLAEERSARPCPWMFSLGRCPRGNEEEAPPWLCRVYSVARCQLRGGGERPPGEGLGLGRRRQGGSR